MAMREPPAHNCEIHNQNSDLRMTSRSNLRDKVLLVCAAVLVCLVGGGVALTFELYRINQAWFFAGWSSIFLISLVGKQFRTYFRRPAFVAFFGLWMCIHGATVVAMIAWAPFVLWPPILLLELATGFIAAHRLFGTELRQESRAVDDF
jgi:hypothetical protein